MSIAVLDTYRSGTFRSGTDCSGTRRGENDGRDGDRPTTLGSLAIDLAPVRPHGATTRPAHLSLVPGTTAGSAEGVSAATAGLSVARTPRRTSAWRLTRRGRLTLTCTVALAVVIAIVGAVSAMTPAGAASSVVVERGMTLSEIAAAQLPDVPLSQAVTEIQRANHLSGSSIAVGQELVIPGR